MNNTNFLVVFHQVNFGLAATLARDLVPSGFTFSLLCEDELKPGETLASRLENDTRPLILLVSDNFLRNAACVHQLLPILHSRLPHTVQIIVLAEGTSEKDNAPVATKLDRVGHILQYINFWQDRYLQLRKYQAEHPDQAASIETERIWTRQIAFDIGNLIEYFREQSAYPWEAFTANHYELFFRKSGHISLHADFKANNPFQADDRDIEDLLWKTQKGEKHVLEEGITPSSEGSLQKPEGTPKKGDAALLDKLIAYKNGLETTGEEEEPVILGLDPGYDPPDDWEDDEDEIPDGIIRLNTRDEKTLRTQLSRDPDNVNLLLELASILAEDDKNFNETTKLLETVLQHDPNNPEAFYLLGKLSEQYKEFKLARRYYEKALEADPDHTRAHISLAGLALGEEHNPEDALEHLNIARKQNPEDATLMKAYGLALADTGHPKKAIKILRKAAKLAPHDGEIQSRIASLYIQAGEPGKAEKYFKEDPSSTVVPIFPTSTVTRASKTEEAAPDSPVAKKVKTRVDTVTVLISGATSGIGKATAMLLAENGYRLILTGRREDRLAALSHDIADQFHTPVYIVPFDVRHEAVARQIMRALPPEWSKVDILINNAGLAKGLHPIHEGKVEDWDTMIDTNVKGLLYMSRAVLPGMVARKAGHIINICSTAGKEVYPMGNVYCATKHAVDAITKGMRQDLVGYNIRVGQVSPGHVEETEFALNRFDGDTEKAKIYQDFNPLKATDVAAAILYMIQQPPHVNIHDIILSGSQQAGGGIIHRSGRIYD